MTPSLLNLRRGLRFPHPLPARRRRPCERDPPITRTDARPRAALLPSAIGSGRMSGTGPAIELVGVFQTLQARPSMSPRDLPIPSNARSAARCTSKSSARSITWTWQSMPARSSDWSVNPVAANQRWAAWSPAYMPPGGRQRFSWQGKDIPHPPCRRDEARAAKLKVQMIFQNPYASLNPRLRVSEIIGGGARWRAHGMIPRGEFDKIRGRAQLRRAPRARSCLQAPLSAPVQRRATATHRHRARARRATRIPGLRRGGGGAGRVDPGADPQPVYGPARRAGPDLSVHRPRSRRRRSI